MIGKCCVNTNFQNRIHSNSSLNFPTSQSKVVPAFSYLSPNTEQIPVVTDIRNLLRHSPTAYSDATGDQKCQSHFYQYHQHLQYQPHYPAREGSWNSSPEVSANRKIIPVNKSAAPPSKTSMFSFNFLNKVKEPHQAKKCDRVRREKENAQKDSHREKRKAGDSDCRLIENYLNNPQRSKKFGLTLQQQYFQNQQQKLGHQAPTTRLILESHSYQNVSDEDRHKAHSPPKKSSPTSGSRDQQQMFRKFGDTNLMPRNNAGGHNQRQGGCHMENGVYRYSPHITSFAELDASRNSTDSEQRAISKYLNIDVKTASNSSAYSSGSHSKNLEANRSSPNLNHHEHSSSCSSSVLSDKSTCSTSSLDQRSYIIDDPQQQSYLGPFNFRNLLRPTDGPTESLRKRKGVNIH